MGDYIDAINLSDPRFDPSLLSDKITLSRLAQDQCEECVSILKPIAHRIIGLGVGNHELTIAKRYHFDAMYQICGQLKVKYLGWSSLTRVRISRTVKSEEHHPSNVITVFAEHSLAAGRKKGSKVNALEDRSNDIEADIYLRGHSHDKLATTKVQLYLPKVGQLRLGVKKRVYAICPSFYNAYPEGAMTYGEIAGYPPTSTGSIRIDIEIKSDNTVDYHLFQ